MTRHENISAQINESTIIDILRKDTLSFMGAVDRPPRVPPSPIIFGIKTAGAITRLVVCPLCMQTIVR